MIYERLILMRDLMAHDGSIYVHCDWRVNLSFSQVLDEVFGRATSCNEIIWNARARTIWRRSDYVAVNHDTIHYYAQRVTRSIFNDQYRALWRRILSRYTKDDDWSPLQTR